MRQPIYSTGIEDDDDDNPRTFSDRIVHTLVSMWRLSHVPFHIIYPMLIPTSPQVHRISMERLAQCLEENFPVFDQAYYELRVASRSTGNIQESVPAPSTFRPESLMVGVIRYFRKDAVFLEHMLDRLLGLGAQPDGITSDGPSWISPLVAVEIYISEKTIRDRLHKKLILHEANPNESGWCGKNVLHYRIHQFAKNPDDENLADLLWWVNLPQVRLDTPIFEWQPHLRSRSLLDYLDDSIFSKETIPPDTRRSIKETLVQVLCAFGYPYRDEDKPFFPTIRDVIFGGASHIFYQERLALHWQLSWSQLQPTDWAQLVQILALWSMYPSQFDNFFHRMWTPIEENRKKIISDESCFFMDSIEFNAPQKFPYSWTATLHQSDRRYQTWGGYMKILFQHPVHPQTGEAIPMEERKRLWTTYLETNRLLMHWKDEFVLPDTLQTVMENLRPWIPSDTERMRSSDMIGWVFRVPFHVFLQPMPVSLNDRGKRTSDAFRCVLDQIGQWFRKIHPYSNFHQLLDHKKRLCIRFWKYLIQVLAHRPPLSDCIPLFAFEKWLEQHTDYRFPSIVLRLCVDQHDDQLSDWTLEQLQAVFIKCVYLTARENMDGFHFRFEEEWNTIDFFQKSLQRFGRQAMEHQSDVFFAEVIDFFGQQVESFPYLTFSNLHKKLAALLRVFDEDRIPRREPMGFRQRSPEPLLPDDAPDTPDIEEDDDDGPMILPTVLVAHSILRPYANHE